VQELALKVAEVHGVEIHDADRADAGSRQVHRDRRSEAAGADAEHARGLELPLPFQPDLGDEQVAAVAEDLLARQPGQRLDLRRDMAPIRDMPCRPRRRASPRCRNRMSSSFTYVDEIRSRPSDPNRCGRTPSLRRHINSISPTVPPSTSVSRLPVPGEAAWESGACESWTLLGSQFQNLFGPVLVAARRAALTSRKADLTSLNLGRHLRGSSPATDTMTYEWQRVVEVPL
jgi:hypothetical protein